MQLTTPTNSLDEFCYIDRFNDIFNIATAMKCQKFYVDSFSNTIYGFYDEQYSIIETRIPFKVNYSFFFGRTMMSTAKDIINETKTYFIHSKYPYCFFPENRRSDIMNDNLIINYHENKFVDKMTGKLLDDCFITIPYDDWFRVGSYMNTLQSYFNRRHLLDNPIVFMEMQENEAIQKVISNKVSQGTELLTLRTPENTFLIEIFKSVLGPLTKSDKLSICIQKDKFESNKFAATFSVYKKKPKLNIPEMSDMQVDTHVFLINLA